jgi:hypothetical protein
MTPRQSNLCVGDWVEVRSKDEILRTLDRNGQLDGMPFMPEMLAFCGKRFQVYKRAHKTCDTVFPVRGRRVDNAVHLDTRCDGSSHGGCQAGCLIFWKEAWLRPVSESSHKKEVISKQSLDSNGSDAVSVCTEADILAGTHAPTREGSPPVYICQATKLPSATSNLEWWEVGQYVEDYRSGNATLWQIVSGAIYFLYLWLSRAGFGLGRPMRWFYDGFYFVWRGAPFPRKSGRIPEGQPTPVEALNIQPGELVRVKAHDEILKTINSVNRNRGLYFDAEEVPYCGGTYRVLRRVHKIINERTGHMLEMKTPCIVLDSVICRSRYSECRLLCPRSIYAYWREIWLERVPPESSATREGKNA